jgi:hypothetical protein
MITTIMTRMIEIIVLQVKSEILSLSGNRNLILEITGSIEMIPEIEIKRIR